MNRADLKKKVEGYSQIIQSEEYCAGRTDAQKMREGVMVECSYLAGYDACKEEVLAAIRKEVATYRRIFKSEFGSDAETLINYILIQLNWSLEEATGSEATGLGFATAGAVEDYKKPKEQSK